MTMRTAVRSVALCVFAMLLLAGGSIAWAAPLRAYVVNSGSNSVTVIDVATRAAIHTIPVGLGPSGIVATPDGKFLYVANTTSNTVSVIDTLSNTVVQSVNVGPAPTAVTVTPDGAKVYIANTGDATISVIHRQTGLVSLITGGMGFGGVSQPSAFGGPYSYLAVTPDGALLYVTNTANSFNRRLSIIDVATDTVLPATVPLTTLNSGSVAISNTGTIGYVSEWFGYIDAFNPVTRQWVQRLTLSGGNSGISLAGLAILPNSTTVYVAAQEHNRVYSVDMAAGTWVGVNVGRNPVDVAITDDAQYVYVTNRFDASVSVIRRSDNTVIALIPVGEFPAEIAFVHVNSAPVADAGADFSVDEGRAVTLDGSGSHDPDGDVLTYSWEQVADGSPNVQLTSAHTAHPSFSSPAVPIGGTTLTFTLTVTATGGTATDTVSVTVVNVNHPPVAEAGGDQSVLEGSPVTLHGDASFDIDTDPFTYQWEQVSGPSVVLTGASTPTPAFAAPFAGTNGAAGVVATLTFRLSVTDGYPLDAPAPGYSFENSADTVTVFVTNVNNAPSALAGDDQTIDEHKPVTLNGMLSNDPDGDLLSYAWTQIAGPPVSLTAPNSTTPTLVTPFVSAGGADLVFRLTIQDGYGGSATDTVTVHVQNANDPPLASAARPTISVLWPPNHALVRVGIVGITDPDNNATVTITSVAQDEPTNGLGDGDTPVDAVINADGTVLLRAERDGTGDGRVYHVHFTASDLEGSTSGVVTVSVPPNAKTPAVDGGEAFDATR